MTECTSIGVFGVVATHGRKPPFAVPVKREHIGDAGRFNAGKGADAIFSDLRIVARCTSSDYSPPQADRSASRRHGSGLKPRST